jgi:hypothetical protein
MSGAGRLQQRRGEGRVKSLNRFAGGPHADGYENPGNWNFAYMNVPGCLAWLQGLVPERDLRKAGAFFRKLKRKGVRLPASEPAPIRLRGPNGKREYVWSLDAMPYEPASRDAGPEPPDEHSELEWLGFDHLQADYIVAVNYEKCPAKDLCRRLGCDAREVERRAASVKRRIARMQYDAAVAHEHAFLQQSPGSFTEPWPED